MPFREAGIYSEKTNRGHMNAIPVLLVEDDPDIGKLLEYAFTAGGFAPERRANGEDALNCLRGSRHPLVILDIMLPGMDGIAVLKEIRRDQQLAATSVIMLTAKGEEMDRVVGLELGADDYVVKPFSSRELLLRARALVARARAPEENAVLRAGPIIIDAAAHRVTVDGAEIVLTATEFKLLAELARHPGQALSRDRLLESVWDYSFDGYARTVDTHMRRLRQKLGTAAETIETLRGVGYRFKADSH